MKFTNGIKRAIHYVCNCFRSVTKTYPRIVTLPKNELLVGRVALITGGTSGIGYEIARSFINAGARVVITGRNKIRIEESVKLLQSNHASIDRVYGIVMDITDIKSIEIKFQEVINLIGKPIDILVNNAGVNGCGFFEGDEQSFDNVINTNLKGCFFLTRVVAKNMLANNIKGNILNIASSSSLRPAISAYGLSKWGILGFTQGLARMLTPKGIIVNGIAPGPTATPMQGKENNDDIYLSSNLTRRFALPEEIANMAVILVSDMCRTVVGDVIYMTGGSGLIYNKDISYPFDNE